MSMSENAFQNQLQEIMELRTEIEQLKCEIESHLDRANSLMNTEMKIRKQNRRLVNFMLKIAKTTNDHVVTDEIDGFLASEGK